MNYLYAIGAAACVSMLGSACSSSSSAPATNSQSPDAGGGDADTSGDSGSSTGADAGSDDADAAVAAHDGTLQINGKTVHFGDVEAQYDKGSMPTSWNISMYDPSDPDVLQVTFTIPGDLSGFSDGAYTCTSTVPVNACLTLATDGDNLFSATPCGTLTLSNTAEQVFAGVVSDMTVSGADGSFVLSGSFNAEYDGPPVR